ncbi:MAG: hypothetical protein Q9208_007564, partial [Pyrenodesmia sp. 3 TL-2023]
MPKTTTVKFRKKSYIRTYHDDTNPPVTHTLLNIDRDGVRFTMTINYEMVGDPPEDGVVTE